MIFGCPANAPFVICSCPAAAPVETSSCSTGSSPTPFISIKSDSSKPSMAGKRDLVARAEAKAEVEVEVANDVEVQKEVKVGIESADEDGITDVESKDLIAGADVKAGVK